jgi:SPP1 gp7 family putative phage head morphogenesis protein
MQLNNQQYWKNRIQANEDKIFKKTSAQMEKELIKKYKQVNKTIENEINNLYIRLLSQGEISINNLYSYGRYFEMQNKIKDILIKLGAEEKNIIQLGLLSAYKDTYLSTNKIISAIDTSFTIINENAMKQVVNTAWSTKHFSESIWDNKQTLNKLLDREITSVIGTGKSKDIAVKNVMEITSRGFRDADRIVRTELNHITNEAQKESYKSNGYTHYEYLAELDERTSPECEELDGQIFAFADAKVGENFPPMHPNCRSTIIPIIE